MPTVGLIPLAAVWVIAILFAKGALYQVGERSGPLAAVFGAALMSTVPTLLSRVLHDMVLSTVAFGVLAAVGLVVVWRRGPAERVGHEDIQLPLAAKIFAAISVVVIAWTALGGHWWDEHNCHNGVVTVLARGIVPPVHPLFPTEAFRYHYGFDVLAAQVRAFTSMSVDDATDVASVVCWLLLLGIARDLGHAVGGRAGAALAVVLVPFGGGLLSLFFWGQSGPLELRWSAIPTRWLSLEIPPPVISNFFQHPQGLGMPLALGVLKMLATEDDRPRRIVLGTVMLGALSLAQIVFFGVMGLVSGVALLYRFAKTRDVKRGAFTAACLISALGVAWVLGGMLERGPDVGTVLKVGSSFFTGSFGEIVGLHVVHFGVPLIALFVAIPVVLRRPTALRVALLAAAVIGFAVPNFVTYERSWDIVKFYGVGNFFANLLLAGLLADLLRTKLKAAAYVVLGLATFTGMLWVMRMGPLDGRYGIPKMRFPQPSEIGEVTAERLEPYLEHGDRVFSSNTDIGLSGGMLTPGFDWRVNGIGYMLDRAVSDKLLQHRRAARRHLRKADLDALGTRFVVLAPGDIGGLTPAARASLEDPKRFELLFEVQAGGQTKRVYRVVD